jgi:diaminopimelate decarboxylase
MLRSAADPSRGVRAACEGVVALDARLESWQRRLCDDPDLVLELMRAHGSPVNLIDTRPMARNAAELMRAASLAGVPLTIHFARKANKALALVDEARRLGLGIDLASEREIAQVLARGVPGEALIMTAAVKSAALLELCVRSGTIIVLDNRDELRAVGSLAGRLRRDAIVALRLSPDLGPDRPPSRFGFEASDAVAVAGDPWPAAVRLDGVHFHLDGYDPDDRIRVMAQAFDLVDGLREAGHCPRFVDMGGGIPMSYLDSAGQWARFWHEHREALRGRRDPITYGNHGLGLIAHRDEVVGAPAVYPYHQQLVRGPWLTRVLRGRVPGARGDGTVAAGLLSRDLALRCEPGRALLDGCGLTAARVAYRKRRRDGAWLIGVEMNRTQCRSTSEDFLVDPLLLRPDSAEVTVDGDEASLGPIEGFLVGAYCIERELLTWRRLRFPAGVRTGDIVVLPNTAGYLMHIVESSSHQMPLARNLILAPDGPPVLDAIDALGEARGLSD